MNVVRGTAIVGGGIIGLSLALELRGRGIAVCVLTRDVPGEAAQRAGVATCGAAGMLALRDPRHPEEICEFMEYSRSLYPELLDRIAGLTGTRLEFETGERLDQQPDGRFASSPEPCIEPRALWRAAYRACEAAGVHIVHSECTGVAEAAGCVVLNSNAGEVHADRWVNCAGAWAATLPGSGLPADAVVPRKGQMIRLANTAGQREVIYTQKLYVCPRRDGTILAGATVENAGFDARVDPATVAYYQREAADLLTGLAGSQVLETWAGLRPGTPDDLPLVGHLRGRTWVAAGHFRDGILLAPGTARVMADLLTGRAPAISVAAFAPTRFANRFVAAL